MRVILFSHSCSQFFKLTVEDAVPAMPAIHTTTDSITGGGGNDPPTEPITIDTNSVEDDNDNDGIKITI